MNYSWIDKYKPNCVNDIIGNTAQISIIKNWLDVFRKKTPPTPSFKNGLLISGPPGIGKTSIAHILLKMYDYETVEFNASELRTSSIITDKLYNIFSGKSITQMMFNNNSRIGVIMDEIDGIESRKECSVNDLNEFINFKSIQYQKKYKKKGSKSKIFINDTPLICISNTINKSITNFKKYTLHVQFDLPSNNDILILLHKINISEQLQINDFILQLIVPYCQNDFRRCIYLLEYLSSFIRKGICNMQLIKILDTMAHKEINNTLNNSVHNILYDHNLNMEDILYNYRTDMNFIPFIIHENFINYIECNTQNTYSGKLDLCIEYYSKLIDSQIYKYNIFNNWYIGEYVGILSCVNASNVIKQSKLKNTPASTTIQKSALISKYNYRFYNLKSINLFCKKLNINIINFQSIAYFIIYSVFINNSLIKNTIKYLKSYDISFDEVEKILKLSIHYSQHETKYTKKKQKELKNIYENT